MFSRVSLGCTSHIDQIETQIFSKTFKPCIFKVNNHIEPADGYNIINQYRAVYENIVNLEISSILATGCKKNNTNKL